MFIDGWIDKEDVMWYIHTHTHTRHTHTKEYYSAIKKNEILPFVTMLMDLEGTEWNKSETERQILYFFTQIWNLKNKWTNKNQKENKLLDTDIRSVVTRREEGHLYGDG